MGTPRAQRLLSRWPSPWQQLMIIWLLVNTDHKCGWKGMNPWTVPWEGGAVPGSIRLGPHLPHLVASDPSHPQPTKGPLPQVTTGREYPRVHQDKTSALFTWCPDLLMRKGSQGCREELGGPVDPREVRGRPS